MKAELWRVAYPSGTKPDASSLGDLYASAVQRAQGSVGRLVRSEFAVAHADVPDVYKLWFSVPWYRIYTLNLDDLEEAADVRFSFPRTIRSVSALLDGVQSGEGLDSVHLNGRARDFPNVTFSAPQYGSRTAIPDLWYQQLAIDLLGHPVVFVGTELDEPPLWQQLALRGLREPGSAELRPPSYLVTPSLPRARQEMLAQYNVDWIPMTHEAFADEVLTDASDAIASGHTLLASLAGKERSRNLIQDVGDLIDEVVDVDLPEFLLGREPVWRDVTHGFAVQRAFEAPLLERLQQETPNLFLVTGTAGAGTSTALMRVAARLHSDGRLVGYLPVDSDLSPWEIRKMARNARWDYLVLDNADRWGGATLGLLAGLAADSPDATLVVGMKATSFERLELFESLEGVRRLLQVVPALEDVDIELLLDALTRASRLGSLRGKNS